MTAIRRLIGMSLLLLVCGFAFAGGQGEAAATQADAGIVEIEYLRWEHPLMPHNPDAATFDVIEEETGVRINVSSFPAADRRQKHRTLIASNNMPDMIYAPGEGLDEAFGRDGVFLAVSEYWDHAPNYKRLLDELPYSAGMYVEGNLYVFAQLTKANARPAGRMPIIRTDLLERYNLDMPQSMEELYDVLEVFKEENPDSFPWTHRGSLSGQLNTQVYSWNTGPHIYFDYDRDKWMYGPIMDEYRAAVEFYARMYEAGILDPNNNSSAKFGENLAAEKSFFYWDNSTFMMNFNPNLQQINPEGRLEAMAIPSNPFGPTRAMLYPDPPVQKVHLLSADIEAPEKVVAMMDYLYTDEGSLLTNWGIEGETYRMVEGEPELLPSVVEEYAQQNDPFRSFTAQNALGNAMLVLYLDDRPALNWMSDVAIDSFDYWRTAPVMDFERVVPPPFTKAEAERITDIEANLGNIVTPQIENFIIGEKPLGEWDSYVESAIQAGAQDLEDLYNEAEQRMRSGN